MGKKAVTSGVEGLVEWYVNEGLEASRRRKKKPVAEGLTFTLLSEKLDLFLSKKLKNVNICPSKFFRASFFVLVVYRFNFL